jgi:hypothetical protein
MPTLTFPVQPDGLLVEVLVDVTAIAPRVIQALQLPLFGSAQTSTASGQVIVGVYEVSLSILPATGSSPLFTVPQLVVTELVHASPGIEFLWASM